MAYDDSALPVSAGKLKQLWDAIRTTPAPEAAPAPVMPAPNPIQAQLQAGGYAPPPVPASPPPLPQPPSPLSSAVAAAGPTPNPPPPPVARMPAPPPEAAVAPITLSQTPDVHMASPVNADMPANARVGQLQSRMDAASRPPTLVQKLLGFAPIAASLIAGKVAGGQAASSIQGVDSAMNTIREQKNIDRQSLASQLASAQQEREKEFDTAQRTTELANAATENNRTRDIVARTLGGSREAVAGTNAEARRDVAQTVTEGRKDVATGQNASREKVALINSEGRVQVGRYAADAAANRQTRSINAAAGRQSASFTHADDKPTAAEDNRADYGKSLDALTDRLDVLADKRPDLFGKMNGRLTVLRGKAGTSDADVAELNNIHENLGQIAMATHGMRNAGHIETAANSIANSWYNSPSAIHSATAAARKNADAMGTIVRPKLSGRVGPGSSGSGSVPPVEKWTRNAQGKLEKVAQ